MQPVTVVFTAKEILEQIHRELIKLGADTKNISVEKWQEYILARAIEDVLIIDILPAVNARMEMVAAIIRSNYRRIEGDHIFTLQQDVGSNKLFQYLSSCDLPFESQLELYRHRITLGPRQPLGEV